MVIEHIIPLKNKVEVEIPPDYINKEVEIVIFPVEKAEKKKSKKGNIRSLKGILGKADFNKQKKAEAWESVVEKKFLSH
jgi:hypothetical protein